MTTKRFLTEIFTLAKSSFLASALILASTGCGVEQNANSATDENSDALINAPIDIKNKWSVGVCAGELNTDPAAGPLGACLQVGTRCTGTLIAPNLVLTARHCVHEIDYSQAVDFCSGQFTQTPRSSAPVRVTTNPSVLSANVKWYVVDQVLTSNATALSCAGDLVVLKLKNSIPKSEAVPVKIDVRELTKNKPKEVAIVGRGAIDETYDTNTYETIFADEGGLKRRILKHIPFVCVSNSPGVCVAPDIGGDFQVDPGYAQVGASILSGDSGSGLVRQNSLDNVPVIIGVNSATTSNPTTGKVNYAFATRLDTHASFLRSTLSQCAPGVTAIEK